MAISYITEAGGGSGQASASGLATSTLFASTPGLEGIAAGSLAVLIIATRGGTAPRDIQDSQGNVWRVDATVSNASGTATSAICSSVLARGLRLGSTITFTVGASDWYTTLLEAFGGEGSPARDVTAGNTGSGTALASGPTAVTAIASELAVAAFACDVIISSFTGTAGYSAFEFGNSWNGISSGGGLGSMYGYKILSSTGAQSASGTLSPTGNWAGVIATYLSGAPAPETYSNPPLLKR